MKIASFGLAIALGAYASVFAFMGESSSASAAVRRQHGITCQLNNSANASFVSYGSALGYSSAATSNGFFYCPIVSDTTLSHTSITQLSVYGSNSSTASLSRACIHEANAPTASCGTMKYWNSALGLVASDVSTSAWNSSSNTNDYAYIYNTLGPGSAIYGFWMSS